MTKILFDSDYTQLKTEDVIFAFEDDRRLVFVDKEQMFASPLTRVATTYNLVSSYCKFWTF